ncbi:MAG: hypothetical protein RMK52_02190 [Chitinophagales bacterium]|nr:hypothetical protein [Chitinophagales bacterium]MDW8393034.1 hypothetical protein [Chitinophagales bacterium]
MNPNDGSGGKEIPVPPEGSLGLLALGDVGLKLWREARIRSGYEEALRQRLNEQKKEMEKKKEELKKRREKHQQAPPDQLFYGQTHS